MKYSLLYFSGRFRFHRANGAYLSTNSQITSVKSGELESQRA